MVKLFDRHKIQIATLTDEQAEHLLLTQKNLRGVYGKRKSQKLKAIHVCGNELMRPLSQGTAGDSFKQPLDSGWVWALTGVPGSNRVGI